MRAHQSAKSYVARRPSACTALHRPFLVRVALGACSLNLLKLIQALGKGRIGAATASNERFPKLTMEMLREAKRLVCFEDAKRSSVVILIFLDSDDLIHPLALYNELGLGPHASLHACMRTRSCARTHAQVRTLSWSETTVVPSQSRTFLHGSPCVGVAYGIFPLPQTSFQVRKDSALACQEPIRSTCVRLAS